jgi:hypothetical protein
MSEPEPTTHDPQEPAPEASGATKSVLVSPDDHAVAGSPDKRLHDTATNNAPVTYPDPPAYYTDALDDAERLLKYAAENGIDVDDKTTRSSVLEARAAVSTGWNEKTAANLLTALTKLAAQLKPVSAESLRSFNTWPSVRTYWLVAICLAALIIPYSVASFISSAISDSIRKDITAANDLVVKLTTQLRFSSTQTPAPASTSGNATGSSAPLPAGVGQMDVITELQTLASLIRGVYARSRQLNWLIIPVKDPFSNLRAPGEFKRTFQLPVPLPSELVSVLSGRILVYQDARSFGQEVVDDVSILYGAWATCILPVLYALLGTCAYLLRCFAQEMSSRTFVPSHSDSARFLIAAIGGNVVGLFSNFTTNQAASISPLAIAFLVGYAVDVFFSFLEGLIQAFTKGKSASSTPPAPA